MILYVIMGAVVLIAAGIVGLLFYLLKKEEAKEEKEATPVLDLNEFKKAAAVSSVELPELVQATPLPPEPQVSLAEESYRKRVVELEEELHQISDKAVSQAQEALTMIDQLKKQNEELEEQKRLISEESTLKVDEASAHLTQLRQDNSSLQTRLESSNVKIVALEDEVVFIKKQMEIELKRANDQIEAIALEKKEAVTEAVNFQIAALKTEYEQLQKVHVDLQEANQQLKKINASLIEKDAQMQYELTKNRAQVSGLERACASYKLQVEELLARLESGVGS